MKMIIGNRGTGKTTELIKRAIEAKGILVVSSFNVKTKIEEFYPELKDRICTFLNYSKFILGRKVPIFIDDFDLFLKREFNDITIAINQPEELILLSEIRRIK